MSSGQSQWTIHDGIKYCNKSCTELYMLTGWEKTVKVMFSVKNNALLSIVVCFYIDFTRNLTYISNGSKHIVEMTMISRRLLIQYWIVQVHHFIFILSSWKYTQKCCFLFHLIKQIRHTCLLHLKRLLKMKKNSQSTNMHYCWTQTSAQYDYMYDCSWIFLGSIVEHFWYVFMIN